jgi:hypothetical protein
MKKLLLAVFAILLISVSSFAQAPDSLNYQAIVRNADGNLIAEQPVGLEISILQGSNTGTVVYTETHAAISNKFGLVNLIIGGGTPTVNTFPVIDWSAGPYFVKVGLDPNGGTTYSTIMGTSQLLSVPYALHANTADRFLGSDSDCGLKIGDTHAGGIIFYLEPCGCHGLVAKASDELEVEDIKWSNSNKDTYALARGLFRGAPNTKKIIFNMGVGEALPAEQCAGLTDGGFTDWYLPSIEELDMMYSNLHSQGIGGFSNRYYWSSTENSSNSVWVVAFMSMNGKVSSEGKGNEIMHTRAVRSF